MQKLSICVGQEQGVGGQGGEGEGVHGNFQNWGQHIHGCLYGVGGVCMYS